MKNRRTTRSRTARRPGARLAPGPVAGGVAVTLALLLVVAPSWRRWRSAHFNPRIAFQEAQAEPERNRPGPPVTEQTAVFEGEVSRTEVRLREAGGVVVAAALTGVSRTLEKRPAHDVKALLVSLQQRGLLPPGVTLGADGKLLTGAYGTLHLRLRPTPFAVEVLALGRERRDGPALLLRVPDEPGQARAPVRYFASFTLTPAKIPEPFAAPAAILACGWQSATLTSSLPAGADPEQLAQWANAQSAMVQPQISR